MMKICSQFVCCRLSGDHVATWSPIGGNQTSSSLSLFYHRLTITNGDSPYCYQLTIISPSSYYHLINILPPPHHHLYIILEPNWRQAIELSFSSMSSLPSLSSSSSPPPLSSAAKIRIKGVSGSPMRRYRPLQ